MSDSHHQAVEHLGSAVVKIVGPAGVTAYGWLTLNNAALAIGALASLFVAVHTALKIWWDWHDRKARRGGGA